MLPQSPSVEIGSCTRCGWISVYLTGGLCTDCHKTREWSEGNRAFCALIHGTWKGRMEVIDVGKKKKVPMPVKPGKGY